MMTAAFCSGTCSVSGVIVFLRVISQDSATLGTLAASIIQHSRPLLLCLLFLAGCTAMTAPDTSPPTLAEVVALSKAGAPPSEIINRMADARAVYLLDVGQLTELRDVGVSKDVLNYMQQTSIEAAQRKQALNDFNRWAFLGEGRWFDDVPFGWAYGPMQGHQETAK
jgi:hypothetical protein